MTHYDVFNGDADGLCALQQLRLADPLESRLVTGVKRDITLLERVEAVAGDQVTVLDLSFDKNRAAVARLLDQGVKIRYFDHHFAGEIPAHPNLEVRIETLPDKGTSLLVDEVLGGTQRAWAVVGTFGDNFDDAARRAAVPLGLSKEELELLRELGIYLNYNGYGETIEDLLFSPEILFQRMRPYADPLDFITEDPAFQALCDGYRDDMTRARAVAPAFEDPRHRLVVLPNEPWARRASGVLANELAQQAPEQAQAMLTCLPDGASYLVSVRAPIARPDGADALCREFPSGGGRKAAAGINRLPATDYDLFLTRFRAAFHASVQP
ncbi:acetyltransferase [Thiocapsa imhoffii]|uniref:Acetyltransferase n=1 Tax=Thiocapsa imhoffii TaxID=382777 RepID=A0A9X1BAU6_9GAMM|nr:acetyltransferase [Thiocapsa imhoffii]MBK1646280.1 acetyltransferase [Thiocapsa imhoffii]